MTRKQHRQDRSFKPDTSFKLKIKAHQWAARKPIPLATNQSTTRLSPTPLGIGNEPNL